MSDSILKEIRTVGMASDWLIANLSKEMCNNSEQKTGTSSEQTHTKTTYTRTITSFQLCPCVCEARTEHYKGYFPLGCSGS